MYGWEKKDLKDLLKLRFCDLKLSIKDSPVQSHIRQILEELKDLGFKFKPHFWLSEEFFSPEDIPGVAIPFYLAHPRLISLEKKMMHEAEGEHADLALRILRHEVGHALEHAYRLHRKKNRIMLFGKSSTPYPDHYIPKPHSRSFVLNLQNGYAQSHPDEDFAETFAVWLNPHSNWRVRYQKWPALKKLLYVDRLMAEIIPQKMLIQTRRKVDPIEKSSKTLHEYYLEKRARFGLDQKQSVYDRDLKKLFSKRDEYSTNLLATAFIRMHRKPIRKHVSHWTGQYQYAIEEVIENIYKRCHHHSFRLIQPEEKTVPHFTTLVTVQTMKHLHEGGFRVAL